MPRHAVGPPVRRRRNQGKRKSVKPAPVPRRSWVTLTKEQWRSIASDLQLAAKWAESQRDRESAVWLGEFVKSMCEEIRCHTAEDNDRIRLEREVDDWIRCGHLVMKCRFRGYCWPEFMRQVSASVMEEW